MQGRLKLFDPKSRYRLVLHDTTHGPVREAIKQVCIFTRSDPYHQYAGYAVLYNFFLSNIYYSLIV
jgi:hypothetical protein